MSTTPPTEVDMSDKKTSRLESALRFIPWLSGIMIVAFLSIAFLSVANWDAIDREAAAELNSNSYPVLVALLSSMVAFFIGVRGRA